MNHQNRYNYSDENSVEDAVSVTSSKIISNPEGGIEVMATITNKNNENKVEDDYSIASSVTFSLGVSIPQTSANELISPVSSSENVAEYSDYNLEHPELLSEDSSTETVRSGSQSMMRKMRLKKSKAFSKSPLSKSDHAHTDDKLFLDAVSPLARMRSYPKINSSSSPMRSPQLPVAERHKRWRILQKAASESEAKTIHSVDSNDENCSDHEKENNNHFPPNRNSNSSRLSNNMKKNKLTSTSKNESIAITTDISSNNQNWPNEQTQKKQQRDAEYYRMKREHQRIELENSQKVNESFETTTSHDLTEFSATDGCNIIAPNSNAFVAFALQKLMANTTCGAVSDVSYDSSDDETKNNDRSFSCTTNDDSSTSATSYGKGTRKNNNKKKKSKKTRKRRQSRGRERPDSDCDTVYTNSERKQRKDKSISKKKKSTRKEEINDIRKEFDEINISKDNIRKSHSKKRKSRNQTKGSGSAQTPTTSGKPPLSDFLNVSILLMNQVWASFTSQSKINSHLNLFFKSFLFISS